MKIGAHISAAMDIALAPSRARKIGGECFQFFSRPPQGGKAKPITAAQIKKFKEECRKYQLNSYIHAPYYINLASANNRVYYGSISVLREELARGAQLGVNGLMTHLGSAKELGEKKGLEKVIAALEKILNGDQGQTKFLIEMSAGAGNIIGDTFEEIQKIIHSPKLKKYDIGVCFDTAHAFASGYDLKDKKAVEETFKKFDKIIGLENLYLIHANDTKVELGSHKDRHEHIGEGKISLEGFKAIILFAKKQKINMILETPHDGKDIEDIKLLKKLRAGKN
ncbi:MAG: deoxyribonuclease IV [Patescibacteria group bacterium]